MSAQEKTNREMVVSTCEASENTAILSVMNAKVETSYTHRPGLIKPYSGRMANATLKRFLLLFVLFSTLGIGSAIAQSRINFMRYQSTSYNSYSSKWENWPVEWKKTEAYAIVSSVYDETYKVSVYSWDNQLIVTSICTYDPEMSSKKRKEQNLPYLNCYKDGNGNQIWTNKVSLRSLLQNVKGWSQEGAQLYVHFLNASPFSAYVFE